MTLQNGTHGTDVQTDRQTDRQTECDAICGPLLKEEGRIIKTGYCRLYYLAKETPSD